MSPVFFFDPQRMFTQEITPRRHSLRKVHIIRKLRKNGDHSRGVQTGTHKADSCWRLFPGGAGEAAGLRSG